MAPSIGQVLDLAAVLRLATPVDQRRRLKSKISNMIGYGQHILSSGHRQLFVPFFCKGWRTGSREWSSSEARTRHSLVPLQSQLS